MENSENTQSMNMSQPDPALKRLEKLVGTRPSSPRFSKTGDDDDFSITHGRGVGTDAGCRPLCCRERIDGRGPFFENTADKLVDEMRMGTSMASSIGKAG